MSEKKRPEPDKSLNQSPGYAAYQGDDDAPKGPNIRPYLPLGAGGAVGGLLGVLLGHLAVVGCFKASPEAGNWFKGTNGPPFFSLALSTSTYYAFLGAGLFRGSSGRLKGAGLGLASGFLSFTIPMIIATRSLSYEMISNAPAFSWVYLVLGVYALAAAVSLFILGTYCGAGERFTDWRAGLGAMGGAAFAYMVLQIATSMVPSLHPAMAPGILPHTIALVDGSVSGCVTGLAIAFTCVFQPASDSEEDEHI